MNSEQKVAANEVDSEPEVAQKDRVVLVTGASKGFGYLTCEKLIADGYKKVYGGSRTEPKQKYNFNWLKLDVTDINLIKSAINEIIKKEKRIDVLINNAGIPLPPAPIQDLDLSYYRQVFDVNYFGLITITQLCLPHLLKNKGKHKQIINVSSNISLVAIPFLSGYVSTKAALDRFTEALCVELSEPLSFIKVQLCSPGASDTEFAKQIKPIKDKHSAIYKERYSYFEQNMSQLRSLSLVEPEEVAKCLSDMVNNKLNDFKVYPGEGTKFIQFLNSKYSLSYSHHIEFAKNCIKKPEPKQK